ncbi:flagellar hook protein FlgE [Acidisoma sp. C75]
MSVNTAATGLQAAQTALDVVSNNLANADTAGFKSQLALFNNVYPSGETGVPGDGVQPGGIDTNASAGATYATGNPLDAAISGSGYFLVNNGGATQYTRDGAFQLSSTGQLVTASGQQVLGYATSASGGLAGGITPLTVNTASLPATASSKIGLAVNLNSGDSQFAAPVTPVPGDATTYNEQTSVVAYDSLGNANTVNLYFQQEAPTTAGGTPTWNVYSQPVTSGGTTVSAPSLLTTLAFNSSGVLTSGSPANLNVNWGNGSAASSVAMNFTGTTLGAQSFAIAGTSNNGYAPGSYTGTSIASDGSIEAKYSNGQTKSVGTVAIANFINPQGLQNISGNFYAATNTSGTATINLPGVAQAGTLLAGNLEQSNVSTSNSLVQLIQFQQAYQANASELQAEQQNFTKLAQI